MRNWKVVRHVRCGFPPGGSGFGFSVGIGTIGSISTRRMGRMPVCPQWSASPTRSSRQTDTARPPKRSNLFLFLKTSGFKNWASLLIPRHILRRIKLRVPGPPRSPWRGTSNAPWWPKPPLVSWPGHGDPLCRFYPTHHTSAQQIHAHARTMNRRAEFQKHEHAHTDPKNSFPKHWGYWYTDFKCRDLHSSCQCLVKKRRGQGEKNCFYVAFPSINQFRTKKWRHKSIFCACVLFNPAGLWLHLNGPCSAAELRPAVCGVCLPVPWATGGGLRRPSRCVGVGWRARLRNDNKCDQ